MYRLRHGEAITVEAGKLDEWVKWALGRADRLDP
jgi:hypothetical protein